MNVIERFQKAAIANAENPLFAPIDDEYLGKELMEDSFHTTVNGNLCRCFVFDNGEHFVHDMCEGMLYPADSFPQEWFIHKYLERIIYEFKENISQHYGRLIKTAQ